MGWRLASFSETVWSQIRPKCQRSIHIQNKDLTKKMKSLNRSLWSFRHKEYVNSDQNKTKKQEIPSNSRVFWDRQAQWAQLWCLTCFLTTLEILGGLLWSPQGPPKCWSETNRLPDISPAKWVYFRSAENCSLGSATMPMPSHVQVPTWQGNENTYRRERKLEEVNKGKFSL